MSATDRQARIDARTDAIVTAALERWFRAQRVVNLYTEAEMTKRQVAEVVGVSAQTVSNILRAEGVKTRPRGTRRAWRVSRVGGAA